MHLRCHRRRARRRVAAPVIVRTGWNSTLRSVTPFPRIILLRLPPIITERFSTKGSLGLNLTIGLVIAGGATWIFAALLDAVFDRATMVRWDVTMADRIHAVATPAGSRIFDWVTRVGSPTSMTWMTILICLLLFSTRRVQLGILWVAVFAGGALLESILKLVVHRTRPEYAGHYLTSGSYSFPSGHATLSFLGIAMLVYTLLRTHRLRGRWPRIVVIGAGAAWVLLVGWSRIYLGVHFPSDVVGGYTIAAAWFTACVTLASITQRRRLPPTP